MAASTAVAFRKARKPSGLCVAKKGSLFIAIRHCCLSSVFSSSAMLRVLVVLSGAWGSPVPLENRPTTGTSCCEKRREIERESAEPFGVKVPAKQMPFPCARRKPGGKGFGVSPTSAWLTVRDPSQPAVHAKADASVPATTAIAASAPQVFLDLKSSFDIDVFPEQNIFTCHAQRIVRDRC